VQSPGEIASKIPTTIGSGKLLSTRRGTIIVAVLAGVAALALLLVFMSNYRNSVAGTAPVKALVAGHLIESGTSGNVVADGKLFDFKSIPEDQLSDGAFTDPGALVGKTATKDIYPGQQLTAGDFAAGADPITAELSGTDRAISVPVDTAHGNVGQVEEGSRVDVLGGVNAAITGGQAQPILNILARDVLVLKAPDSAPSSGVGTSTASRNQQVVLRVSDLEASRIALASDQGDVWLTIRPPTLAKDSKIDPVQTSNLLGTGG
jgi:pilus assembly protein CpaB